MKREILILIYLQYKLYAILMSTSFMLDDMCYFQYILIYQITNTDMYNLQTVIFNTIIHTLTLTLYLFIYLKQEACKQQQQNGIK